MKELPITILVYEGPIARAYLTLLKQHGFMANEIILILDEKILPKKGFFYSLLPMAMKTAFLRKFQEAKMHYWPRHIRQNFKPLYTAMTHKIKSAFSFQDDFFEQMYQNGFFYESYARKFRSVVSSGLKDQTLAETLKNGQNDTVLYTGGGIVPKSLLDLPDKRFIHVHPGHLPEVRGSDGILWSTLVRKKPGASCFYMKPGIDLGDLVEAIDHKPLTFDLPKENTPNIDMLYRAIFSYYDPIIRAQTLLHVINMYGDDLHNMPCTPQDEKVGTTYHFMHQAMKKHALEKLFVTTVTP